MHMIALALLTFALGMRHGFDYDHLAAIADITSVQRDVRHGLKQGLIYALGHSTMLFIMIAPIVLFKVRFPTVHDRTAEVMTGITLIVLGFYVFLNSVRANRCGTVPRSKMAMLIGSLQRLWWCVRKLWNKDLPEPHTFRFQYTGKSVFGIGMIHGLGAETPTQLGLFILASSAGGIGSGFLILMLFLVGLLLMNMFMTITASGVVWWGKHDTPWLRYMMTYGSAAYS